MVAFFNLEFRYNNRRYVAAVTRSFLNRLSRVLMTTIHLPFIENCSLESDFEMKFDHNNNLIETELSDESQQNLKSALREALQRYDKVGLTSDIW